jgi:hypothetical protein
MTEPWLTATALIVTDPMTGRQRFFRGWNKAGALTTAWSLAGAILFLDEPVAIEHPDLKKIKVRLSAEGRLWRQVEVRAGA